MTLVSRGIAGAKFGLWALGYLSMWRLSHWLFRKTFRKDILDWQPDVIHGHDNLSLPLIADVAAHLDIPGVYDSHELDAHRNHPLIGVMRGRITRLERRYLPQMRAVTTVGERIAEMLGEDYAIAQPTVLYNAPPLDPAPLPERWRSPSRTDLRAEAGLPEGMVLLVYTGNIADGRGIEDALAGLAAYKAQPDAAPAHLALVGRVTSPAYRQQLERLAQDMGVAEQLSFHAAVSPTSVAQFIQSADIAVLPIRPLTLSYQYAMPNKLFEALHAGLPILATNLEEMGAFIRRHQIGMCYKAGSISGFCEALVQVIALKGAEPDLHARMAALAETYCWERQGEALACLYAPLGDPAQAPRVAMVVPNPCDPDFRVVKQAESLARAGYQVRVFCTQPGAGALPPLETLNSVEYARLEWSPSAIVRGRGLRHMLRG